MCVFKDITVISSVVHLTSLPFLMTVSGRQQQNLAYSSVSRKLCNFSARLG